MVLCLPVTPWAMLFGPLRGTPFFWRLFDSASGVFGIIPLWLACRDVRWIVGLWHEGEGES